MVELLVTDCVYLCNHCGSTAIEFVAGEVVYSLIGFTNEASVDFIVTAIEASFR